jgi:hypothetical protein
MPHLCILLEYWWSYSEKKLGGRGHKIELVVAVQIFGYSVQPTSIRRLRPAVCVPQALLWTGLFDLVQHIAQPLVEVVRDHVEQGEPCCDDMIGYNLM